MLDTGVVSHSEFAEPAVKEVPVRWGKRKTVLGVTGLTRKQLDKDEGYRKQKEALFTVGRMIRDGNIEAFTYIEIEFEGSRGRGRIQEFNALQGCTISHVRPAVDRSRFRKTAAFADFVAKGGKKDRRSGIPLGEANQIAFLEWLYALDEECVSAIIGQAHLIGLSPFEIESLKGLAWFQLLCKRSGSSENYPDVFHLWTAERHHLDAFLTLEKILPNLVDRVRHERSSKIEISTEVLRPLDLLQRLGIPDPDPVPINGDHFYRLV
jgi:hypothetical protein